MQFDPAQLEQIENRIDLIRRLKHKYGCTEEIVIKSGEQARAALAQIELSDERLSELNAEAAKIYPQLLRLAEELTAARKKAADCFSESVGEELRFLDMPNVKLSVSMEEGKPRSAWKRQCGIPDFHKCRGAAETDCPHCVRRRAFPHDACS